MALTEGDYYKMLVAGVGGQGVIFLTNLLTEVAVSEDIPVASSEIHGIAQRRGSVIASVTFGRNTFGFIEERGAHLLLGLEPLEAMRCLPWLNPNSVAVIDDNRILPHSINVGSAGYPDVEAFIDYLKRNLKRVVFNRTFDAEMSSIMRNIYILGRAVALEGFPLTAKAIEKALKAKSGSKSSGDIVKAFRMGIEVD